MLCLLKVIGIAKKRTDFYKSKVKLTAMMDISCCFNNLETIVGEKRAIIEI